MSGTSKALVGVLTVVAMAGQVTMASASQPARVTNSLGMEFVFIPSGSFVMGSPSPEAYRDPNESEHGVTLTQPFYMQVTEVTQGQWKALMGSNPSAAKACGDACPVERVSWQDCIAFIEKLNGRGEGRYRLPTEAEWEYACRAGTKTTFSWGDAVDCSLGMFNNNSRRGAGMCIAFLEKRGLKRDSPAPVRSYPANPWGLFDMHGNVWEWCQDWFAPYPKGDASDPKGPASGVGRVRRGGSWFKYATFCRSANRNYAHPGSRYATAGFRLVRDIQ